MYSQSFIGREIFAAIWGIAVVCAAASELGKLQFPFDPQLKKFANQNATQMTALFAHIQRYTGISDPVMQFASTDALWAGIREIYATENDLRMELILAAPSPAKFVNTDVFDRLKLDKTTLREGCVNQLERLLAGLLAAHWAFIDEARTGQENWSSMTDALHEIFATLSPIVRHVGVCETSLLDTVLDASWDPSVIGAKFENAASEFVAYVVAWRDHMNSSKIERLHCESRVTQPRVETERRMRNTFRARLVTASRDALLTLLFETLWIEFVHNDGVWSAMLFGGTKFTVVADPQRPDWYELTISSNPSDPLFSHQQKQMGPIEDMPAFLSQVFAKDGIACEWDSE